MSRLISLAQIIVPRIKLKKKISELSTILTPKSSRSLAIHWYGLLLSYLNMHSQQAFGPADHISSTFTAGHIHTTLRRSTNRGEIFTLQRWCQRWRTEKFHSFYLFCDLLNYLHQDPHYQILPRILCWSIRIGVWLVLVSPRKQACKATYPQRHEKAPVMLGA